MASYVEEGMANSHENGIEIDKNNESPELNLLKTECQKWKSKSEQLQTELNETKSEVAVANCVKVHCNVDAKFMCNSVSFTNNIVSTIYLFNYAIPICYNL